jgi:hypothetical protein
MGQAQQMNGPPPQAPSNLRPNNSAGLLGPRPVMQPNAQAFTSLAPLHGQAFGTNPPPIPGTNVSCLLYSGTITIIRLQNYKQKSITSIQLFISFPK